MVHSGDRMMLNMLGSLAEYERELIAECVNAGIAAARQSSTRIGRPLSKPGDSRQVRYREGHPGEGAHRGPAKDAASLGRVSQS